MTQQPFTMLLVGGLDTETPALAIPAGTAISAFNYESTKRGYTRETGYERFDGRALASEQIYAMLAFTSGSASPAVGTTINGQTSGATAWIIAEPEVSSGAIALGNAVGRFVILMLSGDFEAGENIRTGTTVIAICSAEQQEEDADTEDAAKVYAGAAADAWRATIGALPGSGPARGVFKLGNDIYAFRDNSGGTAGKMFKATAAGWIEQTLGSYIAFDTATAAPLAGDTVTGPSGSAIIDRVINNQGAYGDPGGASGYLVVHGVTGTFSAGQNLTTSPGSGVLKASGTAHAITLPPGGTYDVLIHNFYGSANLERAYGANGVGRAFEWDGTVFVPIWTGLSDDLDKPTHVSQRAEHLFLGYVGGALQYSSIGEPVEFNGVTGSGEVGFGTTITGIIEAAETALIVYGAKKIGYITGTSAQDFKLDVVTAKSGAFPWTAQQVTEPVYMDAGGLRGMTATNTTGGWALQTKTDAIKKLLDLKREAGIMPVASCVLQDRAQYRVFYSDGSGISLYLGREKPEPMAFQYGFTPTMVWVGKGDDLSDEAFTAADDGFIYRLFSGRSFDGEAIESFLRIAYNNINSPMTLKRFHGVSCDVDSPSNVQIGISADFSYGDDQASVSAAERVVDIPGGGGYWDEAVWGRFIWSAPSQSKLKAQIYGKGSNISVSFVSSSNLDDAHTLTSMSIMWTKLRELRV